MPKTKISEFSATPGNNTDIDGINIAEGCAPSGINDAIRELMSQLKDFQAGTAGDSFNGPVGTTTPAAGAFTTLSASGNITVSGGTANGVAYLNGSKVLTTGSALTFDGQTLTNTRDTPILNLNDTAAGNVALRLLSTGGLTYIQSGISGGAFASIAFTANGGGSEQMRLTSTGLGIGTSSPAASLHVQSTTVAIGRFQGGTGAGYGAYAGFYGQGAFAGYIGTQSGIVGSGTSNNLALYAASTNSITLWTNGTQNAVLDSSGNLGIGTSSPGSFDAAADNLVVGTTSGNNGITIAAGTTGSSTINFADGTAGGAQYAGYIDYQHNGDYMRFGTNGGTERARITSGGNLLVGKTSFGGTATGIDLGANGFVGSYSPDTTNATATLSAYSNGASAYRFYVGWGGTVYATSTTITAISDRRLKENIQDIDVGLDAVMALKPRKFDWKAGKGKDKKGDRGWIAQEFEQVFPEMIDTWRDPAPEGEEPYKAVNADLIPVLVKAIQEQQAIITDLRARVAQLEAK